MSIDYSNFIAPAQLGTSVATVLTVRTQPAATLLRNGRMRLANTTGAAVAVTLYAVPPAGTAGDGNAFIKGKSLAANDYLDIDLPVMPAGASVQGFASSAASVTVHMISGALFA